WRERWSVAPNPAVRSAVRPFLKGRALPSVRRTRREELGCAAWPRSLVFRLRLSGAVCSMVELPAFSIQARSPRKEAQCFTLITLILLRGDAPPRELPIPTPGQGEWVRWTGPSRLLKI